MNKDIELTSWGGVYELFHVPFSAESSDWAENLFLGALELFWDATKISEKFTDEKYLFGPVIFFEVVIYLIKSFVFNKGNTWTSLLNGDLKNILG